MYLQFPESISEMNVSGWDKSKIDNFSQDCRGPYLNESKDKLLMHAWHTALSVSVPGGL